MSILIEGMEMPKGGYIDVRIFCDGTAFFAIAKNPYFKEVEAVPVPEPHGRLIDADKLMKRMWDETDCMISVPATFVRDAPTIIPSSEEGEA